MIVKITGPKPEARQATGATHLGFNGATSGKSGNIKNLLNMNSASFNLLDPDVVQHVHTDFTVEDQQQYFFSVMRKMVHDYPQEVQRLLKDSAGIISSVKKKDLKNNLAIAIFNVPSFNYEFAKLVASVGVTGSAKYANLFEPNWGMVAAGNAGSSTQPTTTPPTKDGKGGTGAPDGMTKDAWDKMWGTVDRVSQIGLTVGGWFMDKHQQEGNAGNALTAAQQDFLDKFKAFDDQQGGSGPDVFGILKWVGISIVIGLLLFFGGKLVIKMLNK